MLTQNVCALDSDRSDHSLACVGYRESDVSDVSRPHVFLETDKNQFFERSVFSILGPMKKGLSTQSQMHQSSLAKIYIYLKLYLEYVSYVQIMYQMVLLTK